LHKDFIFEVINWMIAFRCTVLTNYSYVLLAHAVSVLGQSSLSRIFGNMAYNSVTAQGVTLPPSYLNSIVVFMVTRNLVTHVTGWHLL
jgi:hypothetical protein